MEHTLRDLKIIVLASLVAFSGTLAFRLSLPAVSFYSRQVLESTMLQIGALSTAFFISRAVASLIIGRLIDYGYDYRKIVILSFATHGLIFYVYTYANSWLWIIFLRVLQGLLNGFAWVSIQYALGVSVSSSLRGRAYSIYFSIGSLGAIAGNAIYALISFQLDVSQAFIEAIEIAMVSMLITAVLSWVFFDMCGTVNRSGRIDQKARKYVESTKGESKSPLYVLIGLALAIISTRFYSSVIHGDIVYVYIAEKLGFSRAFTSLMIGIVDGISMVFSYMLMWIADRISDRLAFTLSSALLVMGAAMFSAINPIAIPGLALVFIGSKAFTSLFRRMAITYAKSRGTAIGIVNALGNTSLAIGALAVGRLMDTADVIYEVYGLAISFPIAIAAAILALGIVSSLILIGRTASIR